MGPFHGPMLRRIALVADPPCTSSTSYVRKVSDPGVEFTPVPWTNGRQHKDSIKDSTRGLTRSTYFGPAQENNQPPLSTLVDLGEVG